MARKEDWKDIPGYEGIYQASTLGRIRSLDRIDCKGRRLRGLVLKQCYRPNDACYVCLHLNGIQKVYHVTSIMRKTFFSNCKKKTYVTHKDNNPKNNVLYNLEPIHPANMAEYLHSFLKKDNKQGSKNGRAILNEEKVKKIRSLARIKSQREIGEMFNVSRVAIYHVLKGDTWKHVI